MTYALRQPGGGHDDATLARAAASGDKAAFAAIYDRYADRLHDFCIGMLRDRDAAADCVQDVFVTAATRLSQLREPDRLRSWLYAIARNEALARIRMRKREQPSEELPDMPSGDADLATLAARNELADLIRAASGGLSDRDRTVLELAYRRRLDGPELADALGVTPRNANTLVERMRDTIARSLGALLVCRRAAADPGRCPELTAVLAGWDGEFTVLMRKRVARHIDDCAICEEDRARMVNPAVLLGAAPLFIPAPAWLRDQTLTLTSAQLDWPQAQSASDDQSWWPESDFDTTDLDPKPRGTAARVGLGAALILLALGAAAVVRAPAELRVEPVVTTETTSTPPIAITTTPPSRTPRRGPTETAPPPARSPSTTVTTETTIQPTSEPTIPETKDPEPTVSEPTVIEPTSLEPTTPALPPRPFTLPPIAPPSEAQPPPVVRPSTPPTIATFRPPTVNSPVVPG